MLIRPFAVADTEAVVALWEECGLVRPWNDPRKDIARKLTVQPELFLVGVTEGMAEATAVPAGRSTTGTTSGTRTGTSDGTTTGTPNSSTGVGTTGSSTISTTGGTTTGTTGGTTTGTTGGTTTGTTGGTTTGMSDSTTTGTPNSSTGVGTTGSSWSGAAVIGTAMVGFDGHRGWVNYLAVSPAHRGYGHGRAFMQRAEELLIALGCPKLNLQVRAGNDDVLAFYAALGYAPDHAVGLGKRLIAD